MSRIRTLTLTLVTALVVAAALPGGATAADDYVPFVTDFPKPAQRYVPFVTDFPRPVSPAPEPSPTGAAWDEVPVEGLGAAFAALAALAAAATFLLLHRRSAARLGGC